MNIYSYLSQSNMALVMILRLIKIRMPSTKKAQRVLRLGSYGTSHINKNPVGGK